MSDSSISMIFRFAHRSTRASYIRRKTLGLGGPKYENVGRFWHDYVWSEGPSVLLDPRFLFAMPVTRRIERMSAFASASRWNDAR